MYNIYHITKATQALRTMCRKPFMACSLAPELLTPDIQPSVRRSLNFSSTRWALLLVPLRLGGQRSAENTMIKQLVWLVVWNIFYFPIYWESSSQLTFIFFRGVETTKTSSRPSNHQK